MLPLNNCKVTSEYGIIRSNNKIHKGIDFISNTGDTNVKAIRKGKVSYAGYDKTGFGNYVVILQDDDYKALYCHLKSYNVVKGQDIAEGEIIGIEGTSGNSTGVHLHLEIRKYPYGRDDHIDVAEYLGIDNIKGLVNSKKLTIEDYKKIIQEKSGIDDNSIKYLEFYRYGDKLVEKLAKAMI